MSGLGAFALGAAPLAGGLLVGGMAGRGGPNAPDLRAFIKSAAGADSGRPGHPSSRA